MRVKEIIDRCRTFLAEMDGPAIDDFGRCCYFVKSPKDGKMVPGCLIGRLFPDEIANAGFQESDLSARKLAVCGVIPTPDDMSRDLGVKFLQELQLCHDHEDHLHGQEFRSRVSERLDRIEREYVKEASHEG